MASNWGTDEIWNDGRLDTGGDTRRDAERVRSAAHGRRAAWAGAGRFGGRRSDGRRAGPGPVGGYEGWWNSTPASGDAHGLPAETVAINTRTNQVVDAFNRSINEAGRPPKISDVDYIVTPDPSWPKDSVVIIDRTTRQVIADFRVDAAGEPIR